MRKREVELNTDLDYEYFKFQIYIEKYVKKMNF